MEVVAIANELIWESTDVKSYVTTHEVVLKNLASIGPYMVFV